MVWAVQIEKGFAEYHGERTSVDSRTEGRARRLVIVYENRSWLTKETAVENGEGNTFHCPHSPGLINCEN